MSPRTGRPKVENPKNVKFSIRLDIDTENQLKLYCDKNNITKGEAVRLAIKKLLDK